MGLLNRIIVALKGSQARRKGEATGREIMAEIEVRWLQLKQRAYTYHDRPSALQAVFVGWMQGLHAYLRDIFAALKASDAEFQELWHQTANTLCQRLRSEVLTPMYGSATDEVLSDKDVARMIADIDGVARDLRQSTAASKEAALDQAVNAVRAAEQAGTLAPDPRSDQELKESIRAMWDDKPA